MAMYVLVEFDDNAQAKRFVEKVNGAFEAVDGDYMSRRVRAVWGRPTKFCDCAGGKGKMVSFRRTDKAGWWVHSDCGRPTKAWGETHNHWYSAIGRNLLPGNKDFVPGQSNWGYL